MIPDFKSCKYQLWLPDACWPCAVAMPYVTRIAAFIVLTVILTFQELRFNFIAGEIQNNDAAIG